MHISSLISALLVLTPLALAQTVGNCHPYPGAAARDCLELIGNNLNNDKELQVPCGSDHATITLGACAITTVNTNCGGGGGGNTGISTDEVVRRALTAIGTCALNDRGSISGYYLGQDNLKTCYLYPGQ
jgi:hypothetical protein